MNYLGAALYLSKRTIHSQLTKLYLFDETSQYFKLAHTQDSMFIESLKSSGMNIKHFVDYQGLQGPIKIWQVNYPADMEKNPAFLEKDFPDIRLKTPQPGEY